MDEPIQNGNYNDLAAEICQRFYFSLDFAERTEKVSQKLKSKEQLID
jgi:hypothetical protein